MLRASGAVDLLTRLVAPLTAPLGFPPEVIPLALLKPFTGSGSLALGTEIITAVGPDSFAGRVAAVLLASSETTFYVVAVYFGAAGVTKIRYALAAALLADLAAMMVCSFSVRLFLG